MSAEPTEEDYKKAVEVTRIQMLKIAQLRAEYLEELEKIMPAKKIYKLYEAEEAYKKLLISDMGKCKRIEVK
jgi:predicted nucleotidyltransferase component of viral defense system